MKRLLETLFLLGVILFIYLYSNDIIYYVMYNFIYANEFVYESPNIYQKQYEVGFVKETDDFKPKNYQDILNIIYSALNNGYTDFSFFCDKEYTECLNDVEKITNDQTLISDINNYVSPFNSYSKIAVNINSFGRVNIIVSKLYSDTDIALVNQKIDEIYAAIITDDMDTVTKIRTFHDYIINNTVYDVQRSEEIKNGDESIRHASNMAVGPLYTGKAICGGYTDTMALFLDKIGVPNYKISSEKHIWNLVLIDGEWKHLDLTWDDPVVDSGRNILSDTFFLISTEKLREIEKEQHNFNENVFLEAK